MADVHPMCKYEFTADAFKSRNALSVTARSVYKKVEAPNLIASKTVSLDASGITPPSHSFASIDTSKKWHVKY